MRHLRALALASSLALAAPAAVFPCSSEAHAALRPGGGSSFRGGSSSSSGSRSSSSSSSSRGSSSSSSSSSRSSGSSSRSSGGSSGLDGLGLIGFLLTTGLGGAGVIGVIVLLVVLSALAKRTAGKLDWEAGVSEPPPDLVAELEKLRAEDPNFSIVLLDDFLYALYAQAHTLRAGGALERLSAYLKPGARGPLAALGAVREVRAIIVGAMRYLAVDRAPDGAALLSVEFETNYTETGEGGAEKSFYACEAWSLSRKKGVLSRTPDRARVFTCPSCGAPIDAMTGGRCAYCQATVDTGQFDWVVESIEITAREERGPLLTGTTEERGTDRPTVIDDALQVRYGELTRRDPAFAWQALEVRVVVVFEALQASWSQREWSRARPFVTDNLFQMLAYWIEAYKKARLRNVTEGARVERVELARVLSDRFYDAITLRVFASSLDYTVADDDGRVVGGDRRKMRHYSEYWTLIRAAGRTGPARTDLACPSCGAPLSIEMAGHCAYCRAKVTAGDFDWILSRIEQDDVYGG